MLSSIVLAMFICTIEPNNVDNCQVSYVSTWYGEQDYAYDSKDCIKELDTNFPDDIVTDPNDPNKFSFAGCYRVVKGGKILGKPQPEGTVYLQNLQDADDSYYEQPARVLFDE